jgi:ribosomal protein L34E
MGRKMKKIEICNECGRNVNLGSGLFVNRVLDLDDRKTRKKNNKPFPEGDFICRECEEKLSDSRR